MSKNNKFNKGFTLIEILLVIVLLGLLMSIVLVNLNTVNRFTESRNDIRSIHIKTLEGAITQYRLQEGSYPAGLNRTYREICDPDASACVNFVDLKTVLVPKYLQAIPQDPNANYNTGGAGYSVAVDETTNIVAVKAINSEGGVNIEINVPLPDLETVNTNNPLNPTEPIITPPSIVERGLILHLDAGNPDSYSYLETGNTWLDLSGNNNHGTLTSGVGYNSANGGSLVFDGMNSVSIQPTTQPTSISNNFSYDIWCFPQASHEIDTVSSTGASGTSGQRYIIGANFINSPNAGAGISVGNNGISVYEHSASYMPSLLVHSVSITSPINIVINYTNRVPSLYINGVFIKNGLTSPRTNVFMTTNLIGSFPYGAFQGRIHAIKFYSSPLTTIEIEQNFEATKGRFGL